MNNFYASVECVERGLNPLTTNLVVADNSRSSKTICLAVSPSLKSYGVGGRARLFEVVQRVKEINSERKWAAPHHQLEGASFDVYALKRYPELALDYIAAVPRMALYLEYSARIYSVYLKYIAPEDIHVYSIDEVFLDLTDYLHTYHKTARELVKTIIQDIYQTTGITATAGLGTNLYLSKVAMDIVAKHIEADADGVRIAELDEMLAQAEADERLAPTLTLLEQGMPGSRYIGHADGFFREIDFVAGFAYFLCNIAIKSRTDVPIANLFEYLGVEGTEGA